MEIDSQAAGASGGDSSSLMEIDFSASLTPPPYPPHFDVDMVAIKALNLLPTDTGKGGYPHRHRRE